MERCLNCMEIMGDGMDTCPHCGYVKGTKPKEIYHLYPGTILAGRYVIGTVVGAGGFGVVYRAWDNTLEKMVAIKEYYPATLVSRVPGEKRVYIYAKKREKEYRVGMDRFLEEARNMARFSAHPHIVNTYNYFEENNTAYCVMEYMYGISFKAFIKQNGGIVPETIVTQIVLAVLDALKDIHKAGIIHRDVAPDNVMLIMGKNNTFDNVKLMDFGAARFSKGDTETNLTVVLKPGFAPTEQYKSKSKQGPFTDLYAVGAMMYRALTGVMPEESTNRIKEECLVDPKELNPQISDKVNNIIMRAMAMQPELRFQNTEEFRQALQEKKIVKNVDAELKSRKNKRKVGVLLVTLVLLIGAAIGGIFFYIKRAETVLRPANLTMWVQAEAGEEKAVESTFQDIVDDFCESYPQVEIDVEAIPVNEYGERLKKAERNGEMPEIFESTDLSSFYLEEAAALDKVYAKLDLDDYFGLKEYKENEDKLLKLPVSFAFPVAYINTTLTSEDSVTPSALDLLFGPTKKDMNEFLAGRSDYISAYTTSYFAVQKALPAKYALKPIETADCKFVTYFSMADDLKMAEKNASVMFLKYLLSDGTQYNLTTKSHTGNSIEYGQPLNKEQYETFIEINAEFEELGKKPTFY